MFVRILALMFVSSLSAFGQAETEATEPDAVVPELVGISGIGDEVFVITVSAGQSRSLTQIGGTVGPFTLVAVDPDGRFVEFDREGKTFRAGRRRAETVPGAGVSSLSTDPVNVEAILTMMRRTAVFVGFDDLAEEKKEGMLRAQLNHILRGPDLTPKERADQLAARLKQERVLNIGPHGISAEEGAALGMSPDKIAETNFMHRVGPELLRLNREEGKPPHIVIE